jgi:hypothetical protein
MGWQEDCRFLPGERPDPFECLVCGPLVSGDSIDAAIEHKSLRVGSIAGQEEHCSCLTHDDRLVALCMARRWHEHNVGGRGEHAGSLERTHGVRFVFDELRTQPRRPPVVQEAA